MKTAQNIHMHPTKSQINLHNIERHPTKTANIVSKTQTQSQKRLLTRFQGENLQSRYECKLHNRLSLSNFKAFPGHVISELHNFASANHLRRDFSVVGKKKRGVPTLSAIECRKW
jgi:hypothetical protein